MPSADVNMENKEKGWRELRLPADLCAAVEKQIQGTSFGSLEELLAFALRQMAAQGGAQSEEQERKLIEQRLRELGYL